MPVVRPGWLATVTAAVVSFHALGEAFAAEPPVTAVGRGKYLVAITGCNDCHTPGFAMSGGKTTDKDRLTGDALGYQGPWGTTYAPNLRLFFQSMDEASWLKVARSREFRPPMPTPSIRAMSDEDLRAVYRYIRSLGPAGTAMPAYLPPGQAASGPVVVFPAPPPK
jgi:mono/diheme cytochrome c family protein